MANSISNDSRKNTSLGNRRRWKVAEEQTDAGLADWTALSQKAQMPFKHWAAILCVKLWCF